MMTLVAVLGAHCYDDIDTTDPLGYNYMNMDPLGHERVRRASCSLWPGRLD